jgi:hypothetical protein
MAYNVEKQHGRLIIARISPPIAKDEGLAYLQHLGKVLTPLAGVAVMFTDVSSCAAISKGLVETYQVVLQRNSGKLVRSALYVGSSPTLGLLIYNQVKDLQDAHRQVFKDPREADRWLGEVLEPDEKAVLSGYLSALP